MMKRCLRRTLWVVGLALLAVAAAADSTSRISLPTRDLIYDPFSQKIYASVPSGSGSLSDSVVPIDPFTVTVGAPIPVGANPGKLALSDDGRYLYVALDGAGAIRRVDLATLTPDIQFSLGSNPRSGTTLVQDMAVLPGEPGSIAVARMDIGISPSDEGVTIYDDGVPRPVSAVRLDGSNLIQFAASPARLYGIDSDALNGGLRRMRVDPSGVSILDNNPGLLAPFTTEMQYDGGLITMNSGLEIDPEALTRVGTYANVPYGIPTSVAPDWTADRVFFLISTDSQIQAYNSRTFLPAGTIEPAGTAGSATRLIRWGVDGLAFRTTQSQVYLIRTALLPTPDLAVSFYPSTVTGGRHLTGRLTLRRPAPAGGATITLISDQPAGAVVPAAVTVPAGATSVTFPVATAPTAGSTTVGVSAAGRGGATGAGKLRVLAPLPAGLTLAATDLIGGGATTGTLLLTGPAPAPGLTFTLASDDPATASLPASITIPAGAETATFPVTVQAVLQPATLTLTAAGPAGTATARLRVEPPTLVSFSLTPNPVVGGEPLTGTLSLSGPAPAGGVVVQLFHAALPAVDLPAAVTVPGGVQQVTFAGMSQPVPVATSGPVLASYALQRIEVTLEVRAPSLLAVTLAPPDLTGGAVATGTVTLGSPAPADGLPIVLSSSDPAAAQLPDSVTVPAGERAATFPVATGPVVTATPVTITAADGEDVRAAALQVRPPLLLALTVDPARVTGGASAAGMVTLSGAAPAGGTVVTLASSDPVTASVPARVTVPAGAAAVTFPVETRAVRTTTPVTLFAATGALARTAALTVLP